MKFDPRAARNVFILILVPAVIVALFFAFDLRINLTASHVQVGIWKAFPPVSVDVGDAVIYNKDEFFSEFPQVRDERMRFRSSSVIKRVAAMPGAMIELFGVSGDMVMIDGHPYTEGRILDDSWRKIEYPLRVPEGTVWLMADTDRAYDSRYHGPMPLRLVREKLKPVFVW